MRHLTCLALCLIGVISTMAAHAAPVLLPAVETEYQVYEPGNAQNGAGPMWCYGSTCLARLGKDVFASGIVTIPDQKPLNNVRWTLYKLGEQEAQLLQADPIGRQREPCPLGVFNDGRLVMTNDPTLTDPEAYNGPAQPQLLTFNLKQPTAPPTVSLPAWEGTPAFCEHSYRGFAVDGANNEAFYLQNVGYDTSHWAFLDGTGKWSRAGSIRAPWGAEFVKPEPIRVCYQNMALRDRAAHLMGVSDIIEWVPEWKEYKLILHEGKHWDYDFRRLYYCWTPDITKQQFSEWIKVADCDKTCGHIKNLDLWLDQQGRAHILWIEQSVWDTRVRDKFFPDEPQTYALMCGVIDQGKVVRKTRLLFAGEKQESKEIPGWGRFHSTPDGRLFVFYYVSGADAKGQPVAENRLLEMYPDGTFSKPVTVPMQHTMNSFFTATERGGSLPSNTLDLLGQANGVSGISYARIDLLSKVLARFEYAVKPVPGGSEVVLDAGPSQVADGKIASYSWQIGDKTATGPKVTHKLLHGGPLKITLTIKDAKGNTSRSTRMINLPPAPFDYGLKRWGLVLRVEAEQFTSEGGGTIHVRTDKLNSSGLSLSHADTNGHWLEWTVDVPTADKYYLTARYAVPTDSARALTIDGQPAGQFAFPATGGYGSQIADNWASCMLQSNGRPLPLPLSAGSHKLRLENQNGLGLNLDYFELVATTAPVPAAKIPGWRLCDTDGYRWLMALSGKLIPSQIKHEIGLCYTYQLGPLYPGDGVKNVPASTLRLFEDGIELGPAHTPHATIREQGKGLFAHWATGLWFAASDGSDPRTNGRKYTWQSEE
ncbi:MAG: PKD domain-containing protein [Armatimonadota bacterium]